MTDLSLLQQTIKESGMKKKAIAKKLKISMSTLYRKVNGAGEFTAAEIITLAKILNLNYEMRDKIFFSSIR